jgi:hypothetical protein
VLALTLALTGSWGRRRVPLARLGTLTIFKADKLRAARVQATQDKLERPRRVVDADAGRPSTRQGDKTPRLWSVIYGAASAGGKTAQQQEVAGFPR